MREQALKRARKETLKKKMEGNISKVKNEGNLQKRGSKY